MQLAAALTLSVLACTSSSDARPTPTPDSTPLQQKIVALSQLHFLSVEGAAEILGVFVGTEQKITPARSEWALEETALIADGEILKMGRHMNITFQPQR